MFTSFCLLKFLKQARCQVFIRDILLSIIKDENLILYFSADINMKAEEEPVTTCAKNGNNNLPLMSHIKAHAQSQEIEMISRVIDNNPIICSHILQDLSIHFTGPTNICGRLPDALQRIVTENIATGLPYPKIQKTVPEGVGGEVGAWGHL